jgi:multiple sugar transport system substrate-binding protein
MGSVQRREQERERGKSMITLRLALREFVDFENALAAQIAAFRASHPEIAIEVVPMDLRTLYGELFTSGGLRSGKWNLATLVTDWLPDAIASGAIGDLTSWMAADPIPEWPEGWPRSILQPLEFDGRYYCIPWHDGPECLIYRRDLFESAQEQVRFKEAFGYELAPPRSWRAFEDVAHFFTRPGDNLWGTVFACYPDGHNTLYDFAIQVWSRGGELHDKGGRPTLATRQAEEALNFYRRMVRDPSACYPESITIDSVRSGEAFLSGSIAMMVNWFGFGARSGRADSPLAGKVALAPIPSDEGFSPVSLSVFWGMAIASGSTHKREAYEFLHFLTRPEMDREMVRHGAVGVRLSTWRDAEVRRLSPAFASIEEISLGARRLPRSPSLPEFAEIVSSIAMRALNSDVSSASILADAQRETEARKISLR